MVPLRAPSRANVALAEKTMGKAAAGTAEAARGSAAVSADNYDFMI